MLLICFSMCLSSLNIKFKQLQLSLRSFYSDVVEQKKKKRKKEQNMEISRIFLNFIFSVAYG